METRRFLTFCGQFCLPSVGSVSALETYICNIYIYIYRLHIYIYDPYTALETTHKLAPPALRRFLAFCVQFCLPSVGSVSRTFSRSSVGSTPEVHHLLLLGVGPGFRRFLGSKRPLHSSNPISAGGGRSPPAALVAFEERSGRFDATNWVPEGSLAGFLWVGFWGLGGPWGL